MNKLGAMDAMFLYNDTENTPMHVGGLMYLDVADTSVDRFFADFKTMLLGRIHLVPYLTNRVEFTPLGLDHPVWVRAENFNVDNHLQRITLPAPGDEATLQSVVADLYEPLMDRSRPLWEMWIIDGLANGQVALLQKTHHAAIDGMSSIKAAELMFDFTPVPRAVEPAAADFWKTTTPNYFNLLEEAFKNLTRYWWDGVDRLPKMLQSSAQLMGKMMSGERQAMPATAPRTRLNKSINAGRRFANVDLSLSAIKTIAKSQGVKVNDVVLAICGEGMKTYLAEHGEQHDESFIASCPVSLHRPGDTDIRNQVTSMNVSMCNHVEPMAERLAAIHASANNAKNTLADMRDAMPTDFGAWGMPAILQGMARATEDGQMVDLAGQMPMNVVVSNVPGFTQPMYVAGARMIRQMPMSIVVHGGAVNLTVTSYLDRLDLGVTAATLRVPDIDRLHAALENAYFRLVEELGEPIVEVEGGAKAA